VPNALTIQERKRKEGAKVQKNEGGKAVERKKEKNPTGILRLIKPGFLVSLARNNRRPVTRVY